MGGDSGPSETVPAVKQALSLLPHLKIILVGYLPAIQPLLVSHQLINHPRLQLQHADQIVTMSDRPVLALRQKTQSSMRMMLELVKYKQADACVSAGNTGALMVMAMRVLGVISGLKRPALCTSLPTGHGQSSVMLDLGANTDCSPHMLHQFALMGDVVAKHVLKIPKPKIALLNIGAECIKGSKLIQDTSIRLAQDSSIIYEGFIEGDKILSGQADVIVTDGFTGNIALKTAEGIARLFYKQLMQANESERIKKPKNSQENTPSPLSAMHPDLYNGASLLGLHGIVVKSHGRADRQALSNAILHAVAETEQHLPERISDRFFAEHTHER